MEYIGSSEKFPHRCIRIGRVAPPGFYCVRFNLRDLSQMSEFITMHIFTSKYNRMNSLAHVVRNLVCMNSYFALFPDCRSTAPLLDWNLVERYAVNACIQLHMQLRVVPFFVVISASKYISS